MPNGKFLLFLAFCGSSISQECQDTGGIEFCNYALRRKGGNCNNLKPAELTQCMKTCLVGACKNSGNNRPPNWAVPRPTLRRPSGTRRPQTRDGDDLALPLYAVIIIVVALLVIFIGLTVCILMIKKKWKRRKTKKMARNRDILRYAPPPSATLPPSYMWTTASHNGAFHSGEETEVWSRTMQPESSTKNTNSLPVLNNSSGRDLAGAKEINVLKNETNKRSTLKPRDLSDQNPEEQNLKVYTVSRGKGPAPLPPSKNATNTSVRSNDAPSQERDHIPNHRTENAFGDIKYKEIQEPTTSERLLQAVKDTNNSSSLVREIPIYKDPVEILNESEVAGKGVGEQPAEEEYQSDDTMTMLSERTYSAVTEDTISAPALVSILDEWKDHLQTQREELGNYYKNLHAYIKYIGLKPRIDQKDDVHDVKSELRYHSDSKVNGVGKESSQENLQEAIYDLKDKLVRIETLLDGPQQYETNSRSKNSRNQELKLPVKSNGVITSESRFTIKNLLQTLGQRDCLKVQVRIAEALDTARRRGKMTVASRDGPITCLCKQIHNIMTDILDPRTSTKIELGAHAASTLSSKLLTNIQCNLLPVLQNEDAKLDVSKTSDRIAMLTQQLLDMAKQLVNRSASFQEKDFGIYIKALIDSSEKIMDTTFHLVCTIVDLQSEERRALSQSLTHSLPVEMKNYPKMQLRNQQFTSDSRSKNNYRNDSESHCTSLSVLDVKRLNEDIGRLRQLLDNGPNLPSLSDVTLTKNGKPAPKTTRRDLPGPAMRDNTDLDDASTISCSTCMMTDADESQFFEDDLTDLMYPEATNEHMASDIDAIINEYEIAGENDAPSEIYRPATRPREKPNCFANALYNEPANLQLPIVEQQSTLAESSKQSQMKASRVQHSSFASFHSGHTESEEVQPRHQAMLGRYFGGEVVQPKPEEQKPAETNGENSKTDENSPVKAQAAVEVNESSKSGDQMTNMASREIKTTNPSSNNSVEKKNPLYLLDIPEITVYRNGTKENNIATDDAGKDQPLSPETHSATIEALDAVNDDEPSDETASVTSAENILQNYPQELSEKADTNEDDSPANGVDLHDLSDDDHNDVIEIGEQTEAEEDAAQPAPVDLNESDSLVSEFEFPRASSTTVPDFKSLTYPASLETTIANAAPTEP